MYFYMTDANGLYFWGNKIGFAMGNLRMGKAFWGRGPSTYRSSSSVILLIRGVMNKHFKTNIQY